MSKIVQLALGLLLIGTASAALAEPRELMWDDLVPEEERGRPPPIVQHGPGGEIRNNLLLPDAQMMYGIVKELDGAEVRIPGFVVPLDWEAEELREALLVPYMGACIHMPPPPPNQIVYIKMDKPMPVDDIWVPYWVTGKMTTQPFDNSVGNAAYTLYAEEMDEYEW